MSERDLERGNGVEDRQAITASADARAGVVGAVMVVAEVASGEGGGAAAEAVVLDVAADADGGGWLSVVG